MDELTTSSLWVIAGVCAYGTMNHAFIGLRTPRNVTHLFFAGACVAAMVMALSQVEMYRAPSPAALIGPLKLNLAAAIVFLCTLLPGSVAAYTELRPRSLLLALNAAALILLAADFIAPYSLQFEDLPRLNAVRMAWGETLAIPAGRNSDWFIIGMTPVALSLGFAIYALINGLHGHKKTDLFGIAASSLRVGRRGSRRGGLRR